MVELEEFEPFIEDFKRYSENMFSDENTNIYTEIKEELNLHQKCEDIWHRNNYPGRIDQAGHMKATGPAEVQGG